MLQRRSAGLTRHVFLPLAGGAFVYLLFRRQPPALVTWLLAIDTAEVVTYTRSFLQPVARRLPQWCLMSLPGGLWSYALLSAIEYVWEGTASACRPWWVLVGLTFSLLPELGQATGTLPGTFSAVDLATNAAGAVLALVVHERETGV